GAAMVLATGRGVLGGRMPVGEVIDRALRELDDAPDDAVRIDDTTAGLLDARFEVETEHLPGATGPARFLLRTERSPLEATRTLLGRVTPCVGRERELALLEASWASCVGEPASTVVLVTGGAGFGKTRLSQEFLGRVRRDDDEATKPPVVVLVARGDPL